MPPRHASNSRERSSFDLDLVAAVAASTTFALGLEGASFAVDRLEVTVPSAYAADAANYYVIGVQVHGSGTNLLQWSTLTGADGALAAGVTSYKAGPVGPQAASSTPTQLDVVCTKNGSAVNLPAQTRIRVRLTLL